MSFTAVTDDIKITLESDAALNAFCTSRWGRSLTVKKAFRQRTEINMSEFPIALITRPEVEKRFLIGARDATHTVRIYVGFKQTDPEAAQDDLVVLEELIDDALLADHTRGGTAMSTDPQASANDEGLNHPIYFMVMDVEIEHRR